LYGEAEENHEKCGVKGFQLNELGELSAVLIALWRDSLLNWKPCDKVFCIEILLATLITELFLKVFLRTYDNR
jgi:hypothetical protein